MLGLIFFACNYWWFYEENWIAYHGPFADQEEARRHRNIRLAQLEAAHVNGWPERVDQTA